jgi:hypothetical protein
MHANCIGLAELRNWVVEVTIGVIKDEDKISTICMTHASPLYIYHAGKMGKMWLFLLHTCVIKVGERLVIPRIMKNR